MPPKRAKPKAAASVGLHTLPEDVMLQVLTQLDTTDRLTVGYTCKRLNSVVSKPSVLWRIVTMKASLEFATGTAQWLLPWLHKRAPAVEELHFDLSCPAGTASEVLRGHASRVWPHVYGAMLVCREKLKEFELTWEGPLVLGPWLVRLFPRLSTVTVRAGSVSLEAGLEHATTFRYLDLCAPATMIGSLPKSLRSLTLLNCNLSALPAGLSNLQQLESIELAGNALSATSFAALSTLKSLALLNLVDCNLATVPSELRELTQLKYLYLDGNPGVPAEQLGVLSCLTCLEVLGLSECRLRALPAAISALGRLRKIFCHDNSLSSLAEASSWLSRLGVLSLGLASLCCCQDQLKNYAEHLTTLYISRSGDPAEQRCAGLLEVLSSLPSLASVFYIRSAPSPGRHMLESFEFEQVLHRLQSQTKCEVDYIELGGVDWS